jgi:type 1 glutamine amidotransferase
MMLVLSYGKGRVFHTPMGHADYSMACIGFQETLERGTEWAATGKVERTAALPADFPTVDKASPPAPAK